MCIIAAKYFKDVGWVGVKNRDRNYVPELSFLLLTRTQPHRLLMKDDMIKTIYDKYGAVVSK